jgi:hypothetical protein
MVAEHFGVNHDCVWQLTAPGCIVAGKESEWNNKSTEVSITAGQGIEIASKWITCFISTTKRISKRGRTRLRVDQWQDLRFRFTDAWRVDFAPWTNTRSNL